MSSAFASLTLTERLARFGVFGGSPRLRRIAFLRCRLGVFLSGSVSRCRLGVSLVSLPRPFRVGWRVRVLRLRPLLRLAVGRGGLLLPCGSLRSSFGGWVGFGSPALFFGGGLVGRCACDRSRCRVCFPSSRFACVGCGAGGGGSVCWSAVCAFVVAAGFARSSSFAGFGVSAASLVGFVALRATPPKPRPPPLLFLAVFHHRPRLRFARAALAPVDLFVAFCSGMLDKISRLCLYFIGLKPYNCSLFY